MDNKNNVINIAYCTDANYLEYVAVSIMSVIMNNPEQDLSFLSLSMTLLTKKSINCVQPVIKFRLSISIKKRLKSIIMTLQSNT